MVRNKYTNNILFQLAERILNKNYRYKDLHKGESCYIFGNGSSIKYFDLENFNDRISIGTGLLFAHKDFKKLNLKYYYTGHPFFYYPFWTNPYNNKFEKNRLGTIYKENISLNKDIEYFVSLTNYFGIHGKNISFLYHFDQPFNGLKDGQLHGKFAFMQGALSAMIGIAIYMGFKDIVLIGCDYTLTPVKHLHFYEHENINVSDTIVQEPYAKIYLQAAGEICNIRTLAINNLYSGHVIPSVTYNELTNKKPEFRDNTSIMEKEILLRLDNTNMKYKIF